MSAASADGARGTNPVRVAVVGGGAFGREHADAYRSIAGVELVAIVETDDASRRAWAEGEHGGPIPAYPTVVELLNHEKIDAASIATPGSTHLRLGRELMDHGVDVLIEKPFADTVADAIAIAERARTLGRICLPGHIMRYSAEHVAFRDMVARRELGDVVSISLRRDRSRDLTRRFPGVHPALLTGVHDIDLALWLTGQKVVRLSAVEHRDESGDVDHFVATLHHELGVTSTIRGAYLLPLSEPARVDDQVDVHGTLDHATLRQPAPGSDATAPGHGAGNEPLVAELTHFVSCVSSGTPSRRCTPDDAVHVVEIAEAIVRSAAASGTPIRLSDLEAEQPVSHHSSRE